MTMKLVVFGLTISSSWGNGHATLWRGLCKALALLGCEIIFFERDVPYYAGARDTYNIPNGELVFYREWRDALSLARKHCHDADATIITSYCPDAIAATDLVLSQSRTLNIFYDLDTPVTLDALDQGERIFYLPLDGLGGFDLVLSYTGGAALEELQTRLGARRVYPLYGHVDPEMHRPTSHVARYKAKLSYLGTYARDRQDTLEQLFIEPARRRPQERFVLAGAQYPHDFPWTSNIHFARHLPPTEHAQFFSSSRCTLNITRAAMARMGWCPSGRLFEAAACGTVVMSDVWRGLEQFYEPGKEILLARATDDALAMIDMSDAELQQIGRAARERTLSEHTSAHRARELLDICESSSVRRAIPSVSQFVSSTIEVL